MKNLNLTIGHVLSTALVMLAMVVSVSCSEEVTVPNETAGETSEIDLSAALAVADEFFAQIETNTRSNSRMVASAQKMLIPSTRGNENETDIRLINYADNQGFALMDVRPGMETIYAISPNGQLSFSDTIANPVLKDFFDGVSEYSLQTTYPPVGPIEYKISYIIKEFCTNNLNGWAEDWNELPGTNDIHFSGTDSWAGTAAIAVAKIMSFYKYPSKFYLPDVGGNYNISWDNFLNTEDEIVKNIIVTYLGWHEVYLNSKYKIFYTETEPSNIGNTFRNMTYAVPGCNGELLSKKLDFVKSLLREGNGVYKRGPVIAHSTQTKDPNYTAKNQYWIIDGFVDRDYYLVSPTGIILNPETPRTAPTLLHCVWGDGKSPKGYYALISGSSDLDNSTHEHKTSPNHNNVHAFVETGDTLNFTFKNLKIYGGWYF